MKITLRQLEAKVRHMNHGLRDTSFGLCLDRVCQVVQVLRVPRKSGGLQGKLFEGDVREVDAYLAGFDSGRSLTRPFHPFVDPDTQDGSE